MTILDITSFFYNFYEHTVRISNKIMPYSVKYLEEKLTKKLGATFVEVVDNSDGCGQKFSCVIVSDVFKDKPFLQTHRLVNRILQDELKEIHAFSLKNYTIAQWESLKNYVEHSE